MDILFYKLQDEINDVKKTRTLTAIEGTYPLTVSGTLRSGASKIAPVIDFGKEITYFNEYNYCYIADFGRYYFIDDMVAVRKDLTTISFRVDVLTSFLTQTGIDNLRCFCGRSSNYSIINPYCPDNRIQFENIPNVIEKATIPTSSTGLREFNTTGHYNIALTILSRGTYNDTLSTDIPSYLNLSKFYNDTTTINHIVTGNDIERTYFTDRDGAGCIIDQCINGNSQFKDFVMSLVAFPFYCPRTRPVERVTEITYKISDGSSAQQISVPSNIDITRDGSSRYSDYILIDDFIVDDSIINGYLTNVAFMRSNKYIKTEYYIPYYGWIELDTATVYGNNLVLYYNIDYGSGSSMVTLYDKTAGKLLFTGSCQLGVKIAVSKSNQYELEANKNSYTANYVSSMLVSGVSVVAGALTENPYLVAGGVTGAIASTGKYISQDLSNIPKAQANVNDEHTSLFTPQKPRIRFTYYEPITLNTNEDIAGFRNNQGYPCNKYVKYSDLKHTGDYHTYCELVDFHIISVGVQTVSIKDITHPEAEELKKLCAEGIYV